ncbi:MAG: class I SAM-dependent methyltransferase [Caldilineaceae bacterium SB0664_bin_27]|uniref:Class I SAM-dependent methyltransferase n=1 Tax=Caldilineaceae bacterium SB0664_bin_27 TaxID=2605260 RepID=A0A6B0YUS8_9CHLR|nr:class I SAM-dependent methyltransferase [Caldilineaceae bacterium SB0664_bin_27]
MKTLAAEASCGKTIETGEPAVQALSPYYGCGDQLKAKHAGTVMVSGRRLENWALELSPVRSGAIVLDAGCGWGRFTWTLVEAFGVKSTDIACVDSSHGMLVTAAEEAKLRSHRPEIICAGIQALPFPRGYFDGAMANHVLYHLSNIVEGVRELARVLKEDGWLLATTNSDEVDVPLLAFHYSALDKLGIDYEREARSSFSMENGGEALSKSFREIDRFYFEDETRYSTAEEFLASYRTIGRYRNLLARKDIDANKKRQLPLLVQQQAEAVIRKKGVLRSEVRMGAFVCRGPKQ